MNTPSLVLVVLSLLIAVVAIAIAAGEHLKGLWRCRPRLNRYRVWLLDLDLLLRYVVIIGRDDCHS